MDDLELETEGDALYENNHYEVVLLYTGEGFPYTDGKFNYHTLYGVRNKRTEVLEHACIQLPEAIFTAVGLGAALDKAPWNWANDVVDAVVN